MDLNYKFNTIFVLGIIFGDTKAQNQFPSFFDRPQPNNPPSATQTLPPFPGNVPFDGKLPPLPGLFGTTEPPTDPPKMVQAGNLSCYSCRLDFRKGYESSNQCLGRYGAQLNDQFIVNCGPTDIFCRVERTEVNGMLILLTRDCIDTCYYGCRPKGFGISFETCSECCNQFACNDFYPSSHDTNGCQKLPKMFLQTYIIQLLFYILTHYIRVN